MTENSLEIFSRGSQMLAEANTIQKAKDLKDLALTAADWARRVGAGEAAITLAKAYAFEAEHRMGEMLKEIKKNPGTRPSKEDGGTMQVPPSIPTIAEIGITKNESARAQKVAALPDETFEELKRGKITIKKALDENSLCSPSKTFKKERENSTPEEDNDPKSLIGLKRYWRESNKKTKKLFLQWLKERNEL